MPGVRWTSSILALLGSADLVLMVVLTVHVIPAFVLLDLNPPIPLGNMLRSMNSINNQSLLVFANIDTHYEDFKPDLRFLFMDTYEVSGGVVNKKVIDMVFLGCVLAFYAVLCPRLTPYIPEGKMKKLWSYKFEQKKYSTLANTLLCLLPSFLFCSILDYRQQEFNPASYTTLAIAFLVLAFSCIFIFVHAMILYNTQFNDGYKNEDCYFGASILEPRSITYILSLLLMCVCGIPLLGLLGGIYCLPLLMVVTLWNIAHFRFWDNFPNKILYFIKLAYSVAFLFFCASFLVFTVS